MDTLQLANKCLMSDDICGARQKYSDILHLCPPDVACAVRHNIALTWELTGNTSNPKPFQTAFDMYAENLNAPEIPLQTRVRSMIGMSNCLRHMRLQSRSMDMLIEVAKIAPNHPQIHFLMSSAFIRQNDIESACRALMFALTAVFETGAKETEHYIQCYYEPLTPSVYYMKSGCATNLDLLYCECFSEMDILNFHKAALPRLLYDKASIPLTLIPSQIPPIVFISEHFHKGSVMSNILPLMKHLKIPFATMDVRTEKEILKCRDYVTDQVASLSSLALSAGPHDHVFRFAICCDGHTGSKRALRILHQTPPARIVLDCFGYPFSTGSPAVHYKLVDRITDPQDHDPSYTERKFYIDPCFIVWEPLINDPHPSERIRNMYDPHQNLHRIFAPNNFKKISKTCAQYYRALLKSMPNAELHFKSASHDASTTLAYFQHVFVEFADRVAVLDPPDSTTDHYDLMAKYDVVVDSFPYNGTITSLESLWCGVPVVTVKGTNHRSRVGASILECIGMSECIASSEAEFCVKVRDIVAKKSKKQHLEVHNRLAHSSIMAHGKYAACFEYQLNSLA